MFGMQFGDRIARRVCSLRWVAILTLVLLVGLVIVRTANGLPGPLERASVGVSLDAAVGLLFVATVLAGHRKAPKRVSFACIALAVGLGFTGLSGWAVFPARSDSHSLSVDLALVAAALAAMPFRFGAKDRFPWAFVACRLAPGLVLMTVGLAGAAAFSYGADVQTVWLPNAAVGWLPAAAFVMLALRAVTSNVRVRVRGLRDDHRVVLTSISILTTLIVVTAIGTFWSMQGRLQASEEERLIQSVYRREMAFSFQLDSAARSAAGAAAAPDLGRDLRRLSTGEEGAADAAGRTLLGLKGINVEYVGLETLAPHSRTVTLGELVPASMSVPIALSGSVALELQWNAGLLALTRVPVREGDALLGWVVTQERLPLLTDQLLRTGDLLGAARVLMCAPAAEGLAACFPSSLGGGIQSLPLSSGDAETAIARAVAGDQGKVLGTDEKGVRVIDVYASIRRPLGLLLRQSVGDVMQPVRSKLGAAARLVGVLLVAGLVLLHLQVRPMVSKLVESERRARHAQSLAETQQRHLNAVMAGAPNGIVTIDQQGIVLSGNPAAQALLGFSEQDLGSARIRHLLPGYDTTELNFVERQQSRHKLAGDVLVAASTNRFDGLDGAAYVVVLSDETERQRHEDALFREKERLRVTLAAIGDAVITATPEGNVVFLNRVAEKLTGWRVNDALGVPLSEVYALHDGDSGAKALDPLEDLMRNGVGRRDGALELRPRKSATRIPVADATSLVHDHGGTVIGVVVVFRDVSAERERDARMRYEATHDELTGLLNRRAFESRLTATVRGRRASDARGCHALMYFDLDHFKAVNDVAGHAAGDALLKQVSALMRRYLGDQAILARLGGDEFAAVVDVVDDKDARRMAQAVCDAIRSLEFHWVDRTHRVGASIGVAMFRSGKVEVPSLVASADAACYRAKRAGRNTVEFAS